MSCYVIICISVWTESSVSDVFGAEGSRVKKRLCNVRSDAGFVPLVESAAGVSVVEALQLIILNALLINFLPVVMKLLPCTCRLLLSCDPVKHTHTYDQGPSVMWRVMWCTLIWSLTRASSALRWFGALYTSFPAVLIAWKHQTSLISEFDISWPVSVWRDSHLIRRLCVHFTCLLVELKEETSLINRNKNNKNML